MHTHQLSPDQRALFEEPFKVACHTLGIKGGEPGLIFSRRTGELFLVEPADLAGDQLIEALRAELAQWQQQSLLTAEQVDALCRTVGVSTLEELPARFAALQAELASAKQAVEELLAKQPSETPAPASETPPPTRETILADSGTTAPAAENQFHATTSAPAPMATVQTSAATNGGASPASSPPEGSAQA